MILERFIEQQKIDYDIALSEIKLGRKLSHWMWYIFPQIKGLGRSGTAIYYSIKDANEDTFVMGFPDDLKLKSSMTLFSEIAPEYEVFQKVLDKYFNGNRDDITIRILKGSMD